jgi:EAL domain-containing protein (putative c-di-GMP-specific phosphodiesterase class I)
MSDLESQQPQAVSEPDGADARPRIAIANALRDGWFETWYQPKVDLKRKCLVGAETLARIRHPVLGVLQPGSFVAEADAVSIGQLAEHALLAALSDWALFAQAGFDLHLAVNIPFAVLLELPVAELIGSHRPQSERWPGLIVEVTEDHLVRDVARAKELAAQLRTCGVTIAIDDFGVGYSSFTSLRALPIAELKIAGAFVKNCATDADNGAICQTAIDLAHRIGSTAVAEGVESTVDLQTMMVMGCDFAQGPLIAPFLPKQEFLELLRQRNAPAPAAPKDIMRAGAKPISRIA